MFKAGSVSHSWNTSFLAFLRAQQSLSPMAGSGEGAWKGRSGAWEGEGRGSHVQRQRFLWQASGSEEQPSESLPEEGAGEA